MLDEKSQGLGSSYIAYEPYMYVNLPIAPYTRFLLPQYYGSTASHQSSNACSMEVKSNYIKSIAIYLSI